MGGIPCKPLLENFLFPEFCMAMEIVIKCSADEFSPKNHVLKNNVNLGWIHCKLLFGNPPLEQMSFRV